MTRIFLSPIRAWDVSTGTLGACVWKQPIVTSNQWGAVTPPLVTALDINTRLADTFIVGTHRGDIWEVDKYVWHCFFLKHRCTRLLWLL